MIYEPEPVLPEAFRNRVRETGFWGWETEPVPPPKFPRTLPGVLVGEPVTASDMLAAVEALPQRLQSGATPWPQWRTLITAWTGKNGSCWRAL